MKKLLKEQMTGGIAAVFDGSSSDKNTNIPDKAVPVRRNTRMSIEEEEEKQDPNLKRMAIVLDVELQEKIKQVAYWQREKIQDVFADMVTKTINAYEKKYGDLKPIPVDKMRKTQVRKSGYKKNP